MRPRILELFDSAPIRRESLRYSIELAKRLNSNLSLLVILPFEVHRTAAGGLEAMLKRALQAKEALEKHAQKIRRAGIPVETAVRIGNPRSELVKYVAETGRFEIIIWGASPDLMKSKDHWLVQMKDTLECPVITPFIRDEVNTKYAKVH